MIRFFAHLLMILAAWTLVIKFIFPIVYDYAYGHPVGEHIYWDFWWVIHLWLAWALLHWKRYTAALAVAVSVVEIVIIVVKFVYFFKMPQWDIWSTNWFINKLFVLACFVAMLIYFVLNRSTLKSKRPSLHYS